jgi:membrane-associated phospholipid phosphatase
VTRKAKTKYIILLFLPYFIIYFLLQSAITSGYNLLTDVDKIIPFVPEFVWIYHTLTPVFFITTVLMIEKKNVFFSALFSVFVASVIMIMFYTFFPVFYPRDGYTEASLSGLMVEFTRTIDGANNTFPSAHVTFSWILAFFAGMSVYAKKNKWIKPVYLLWAILISISTVVLKQHFIIDVFSGIALAMACFVLAKNVVYERMFVTN